MVRERNRKGTLMLNCKDVTQLISRSMDASLPIGKRIGVRIHLLMCQLCARYRQQLLLIRNTVRNFAETADAPVEPFGETLSEEARERIRKSLRTP